MPAPLTAGRIHGRYTTAKHSLTLAAVAVSAALLAACTATTVSNDVPTADTALRDAALQQFAPLAAPAKGPTAVVELGRTLFWDERVSANGKTSCASCHTGSDGGADRRRYSVDARGGLTGRHSITVFNAMTQPALRWLADRPDGASLAEGLLTGPLGFKSRDDALQALRAAGYEDRFKAAFPSDAMAFSTRNYGAALAAYQATLVTPSPFDRWLAGDARALTQQQKAGLKTFIDVGCAACHRGPLLGGQGLQKFGIAKPYWVATKSEKVDPGRYAVTKKEEDRYVFRVPMLRNVARTAPYFHDGSVAALEDAVRIMADVQLGRTLDDRQVADIAAFLGALSGEVPANFSPPSSAVAQR